MQLNVGYYSNIVNNIIFDSFIPRRQSELINYLNFLFFTISNRYRLQVDKYHGVEFEEDVSTINFYLDNYDLQRIRSLLKLYFSVCTIDEACRSYTNFHMKVYDNFKQTVDKVLDHDKRKKGLNTDLHLVLMDRGEVVCLLKFIDSPKHSTRNIFTTGLNHNPDFGLIDIPYQYGIFKHEVKKTDPDVLKTAVVFFYDAHVDSNVVPSEQLCSLIQETLSEICKEQLHFDYIQSFESVSARYKNMTYLKPLPEILPFLYKMDGNYHHHQGRRMDSFKHFHQLKVNSILNINRMLRACDFVVSSYSWITHLCKLYNIPHITYYNNYYGSELHKQLNLITKISQPIDATINKTSLKNKIDWILTNASSD